MSWHDGMNTQYFTCTWQINMMITRIRTPIMMNFSQSKTLICYLWRKLFTGLWVFWLPVKVIACELFNKQTYEKHKKAFLSIPTLSTNNTFSCKIKILTFSKYTFIGLWLNFTVKSKVWWIVVLLFLDFPGRRQGPILMWCSALLENCVTCMSLIKVHTDQSTICDCHDSNVWQFNVMIP